MFVGYSRKRLEVENMPMFEDVLAFCKELEEKQGINLLILQRLACNFII